MKSGRFSQKQIIENDMYKSVDGINKDSVSKISLRTTPPHIKKGIQKYLPKRNACFQLMRAKGIEMTSTNLKTVFETLFADDKKNPSKDWYRKFAKIFSQMDFVKDIIVVQRRDNFKPSTFCVLICENFNQVDISGARQEKFEPLCVDIYVEYTANAAEAAATVEFLRQK